MCLTNMAFTIYERIVERALRRTQASGCMILCLRPAGTKEACARLRSPPHGLNRSSSPSEQQGSQMSLKLLSSLRHRCAHLVRTHFVSCIQAIFATQTYHSFAFTPYLHSAHSPLNMIKEMLHLSAHAQGIYHAPLMRGYINGLNRSSSPSQISYIIPDIYIKNKPFSIKCMM